MNEFGELRLCKDREAMKLPWLQPAALHGADPGQWQLLPAQSLGSFVTTDFGIMQEGAFQG